MSWGKCLGIISSAYLSSGVSARGQRRLHHATGEECLVRREGDCAPESACRTIKKLKRRRLVADLTGESILAQRGQYVR